MNTVNATKLDTQCWRGVLSNNPTDRCAKEAVFESTAVTIKGLSPRWCVDDASEDCRRIGVMSPVVKEILGRD